MIWFILGFVFLILVFIICIFVLRYLSRQEKEYIEVSDLYLKQLGKSYTGEFFSKSVFSLFQEILLASQQQNFEYLRSMLADDAYNHYLLDLKQLKEKNVKHVIDQILPVRFKLASFQVQNQFEIAKVWLRISCIDYIASTSKPGEEIIVSGKSDSSVEKEFLVTLVKTRTEKEDIVCPSCGHVSSLLVQSDCPHCGVEIVNKHHRWVVLKYEEMSGN